MRLRLAFAAGTLLLALGSGFAAAAGALDPASVDRLLEPSGHPVLLGPIAVEGRAGWDCEPEHAAEASEWKAAHLPAADTP